jgi:hypothetical protein
MGDLFTDAHREAAQWRLTQARSSAESRWFVRRSFELCRARCRAAPDFTRNAAATGEGRWPMGRGTLNVAQRLVILVFALTVSLS